VQSTILNNTETIRNATSLLEQMNLNQTITHQFNNST